MYGKLRQLNIRMARLRPLQSNFEHSTKKTFDENVKILTILIKCDKFINIKSWEIKSLTWFIGHGH